MTKYSTLLILFILIITACGKNDLDRKNFLIEITTDEVTVSGTTITAGGTISALGKGVQDHGHVWAIWNSKPTVNNNKKSFGVMGNQTSFISELSDLEYNSTYDIRAYAYDGEQYFYGETKRVVTSNETIVKTDTFEIISLSSVNAKGIIQSIGIEEVIQHGHCWSSSNPAPSINDNKTELDATTNVGSFNSILPTILYNTMYYYRSYIQSTNAIIYGEIKQFEIQAPTIITGNETIISETIVDIEGEITENILPLDEYGHCWSSTNTSPTINDSKTSFNFGLQNGSFISSLTNLSTNVLYTVRAYSRIDDITIYGNKITFKIDDIWIQKFNFGGTSRESTVGFSIGGKGYIGTGSDGVGHKKDFWEYDPSFNTWTQKVDFGGTARQSAVGFSIGSQGYIGTGYDGGGYKKDFWEYNPNSNTWTQKADFGGTERFNAVGFSIGSQGYLGSGFGGVGHKKDFWEYNPNSNTWTQKADFGGTERNGAVGFSIDTKGYIGIGYGGGSKKDFWEYNPSSNTWTQKADFGGTERFNAVGFSIGTKGYIGTGSDGNSKKDFWEYNPSSNIWTQKADFGDSERTGAVGFSIGTKGYIGTGWDGSLKNDFWEYIPD